MTDLLLRQVAESRAGAEGRDDFDVIGPDGLVIGRIFKAATSPRLELERSLFCYFVDICAVRFVWGLDRLRL
jgi:hypothetical protein